jgi:hypothetical protein
MTKLLNALGFQAGWWACIASVARGLEVEAIVFCLFLIGIHLRFSKSPQLEAKIGLVALLLGILLDSGLQYFSIIDFYGWALGPLSPFWIWTLWVMFALTLNSSLAFLKKQSLIISACLGLVFGPMTYFAGAKLGAADLDASISHLLSLGVAWMLAMPLMVFITQQLSLTAKDNT